MSSEKKRIMAPVWKCSRCLILVFCLTNVLTVSPRFADNVSNRGKDCYEGMCWCSQDTADCSGNDGRLKFVPVLPSTISRLDFSFNRLVHLPSDFFSNVTQLTSINLTGNGLSSIDQHAFRGLQTLINITLDNNFLDFDSVRPVLNISSLAHLQMCKNYNVTYIPDNIFLEFPLPHLRDLNISGSSLEFLNMSAFKPLRSLVFLDVSKGNIQYLLPDTLSTLQYLILRDNFISGDFIPTCYDTNVSYFPKLVYLHLAGNDIYGIDRPVCLPSLYYLSLAENRISVFTTGGFSKFPKLRVLSLIDMLYPVTKIYPRAFASSTLENVYLSDNRILFSSHLISPQMFADCPRLTLVQLDNNDFSNVSDLIFQELFQNNSNLTTVYLGNAKIKTITTATFKGVPHVEELHLYSNVIADLPDGVFDHLVNLKILRVDNNRLSEIRKATFNASTRQRLRHLNLSNNPYACTCNLRWFRSWLMDERVKFVNFPQGYTCAPSTCEEVRKTACGLEAGKYGRKSSDFSNRLLLPISRRFHKVFYLQHQELSEEETSVSKSRGPLRSTVYLSDFVMSDQACLMSQSTSQLTAVLAGVLVLFMLTFLVLYTYRWHIRLALYEAFRGNPRRRQPEREYEYDVFVSYANEDVNWVRQELIPTLEGRHGLRLCIHQRDFPVGGNIIDNITTSVHSSKRVLFVLSPHFARSRWCQFELVFCQNYAMERNDVIVLTLLASISGRDMTDAISVMFKTTTYLAWGEEVDARNAFWGRLVMAFQDIVPQQAM